MCRTVTRCAVQQDVVRTPNGTADGRSGDALRKEAERPARGHATAEEPRVAPTGGELMESSLGQDRPFTPSAQVIRPLRSSGRLGLRRNHEHRARSFVIALLPLALIGIGCQDPTRPPGPGAIRVQVVEEGTDLQRAGYLSFVDNDGPRPVDVQNLRTTFTNIAPGAHVVRLDGLAPNCTVVGQNPVTVEVANNETVNVRFTVACVAYVGTVRVTTVTTGGEPDPNGYGH